MGLLQLLDDADSRGHDKVVDQVVDLRVERYHGDMAWQGTHDTVEVED